MSPRVSAMLSGVVLAAALPALGADAAKTLQGKWQADMVATTKASGVYKELPPEGQKQMLEEWKKAPAIVYQFTDKTVAMSSGDEKPQTLRYTVLKSEGSKATLRSVVKAADGSEQNDDTDIELVDRDTLLLSKKGEDVVVTLRRMK